VKGAVWVIAAGCAALALRPVLFDAAGAGRVVPAVVVLFALLLAVGVGWPTKRASGPSAGAAVVFAAGVAAFAIGRLVGGGDAPHAFVAKLVVLNTLAAVAEEAFFRRLAYDTFARHGAAVAVGGSAALFAVVHVTVYGWWVLPIDLAAGLVLAWQRWAAGSWTVPAATHVIANLLVVI
jgi:membrane protease YdiL (CAAX protease family)